MKPAFRLATRSWPAPGLYRSIRADVEAQNSGNADVIKSHQKTTRPDTADKLADALIWVIIYNGFSYELARGIWARLKHAEKSGESTASVLGHKAKAKAVEFVSACRNELFASFKDLPDEKVPDWCVEIPRIGPHSKWYCAKSLGAQVVLPDRFLLRLATALHDTPENLCRRVSAETGDRVNTVDFVLRQAVANEIIKIERHAITFNRAPLLEAIVRDKAA